MYCTAKLEHIFTGESRAHLNVMAEIIAVSLDNKESQEFCFKSILTRGKATVKNKIMNRRSGIIMDLMQ